MRRGNSKNRNRKKRSQQKSQHHYSFLITFLVFAGMISILVATGFFYVQARLQGWEIGYQIAAAEKQLQGLKREREHLRLEALVLKSPERIATLAERQLALSLPDPGRIRILSGGEKKL